MGVKFMNLPNKLTIFRIILVPVMVIVSYLNINASFLGIPAISWILTFIFIIASYTDHLDGKLARKNNQITTFGKFADPLADKILVLSAMLILVEHGKIPAWIPIIVLIREFVVSGYRLIAVEKGGKVIAANIWGKIKTFTQMIGISLMFLSNEAYFKFIFRTNSQQEMIVSSAKVYMTTGQFIINMLASIIITVSVIATIFSGWTYLKDGKDLFKD